MAGAAEHAAVVRVLAMDAFQSVVRWLFCI
jgi:hypothetical protein